MKNIFVLNLHQQQEVKLANKKPEEIGKIRNPDGSTEVTYLDGSVIRTHPDGSKDFIDATGKALTKLSITETQIEAWKKMPKEQATKQILELINNNGFEVAEKRFVLDAIWKLAELHGATQPDRQKGTQLFSINVNYINTTEKPKPIDIEGKVIEI